MKLDIHKKREKKDYYNYENGADKMIVGQMLWILLCSHGEREWLLHVAKVLGWL